MEIAIIGAGNVGGALGKLFAKRGHKIFFGVPSPTDEKYKSLLEECSPNASISSVPEAVEKATVIILATPWNTTEAALKNAGDLTGKTLIDCTNPLKMGPEGLGLEIGHNLSGGELVAQWSSGAIVCKCFNQIGFEGMENASKFTLTKPIMFVAGDNLESKQLTIKLATEIGFECEDAGNLKVSRLLEPFGMLWIHLAFTTKIGRNFAFSIIRN